MAQKFEHSSDDSPLRAQRMTAGEARAVIALWQSERVEQTSLTDKPAVPDVAEGLDISVADVQRLLGVVRARQEEEARLRAQEQALSEIRLAEEERERAEIERQRAERRREQAERQHGQAERQHGQAAIVRSRQTGQHLERHTNHVNRKPSKASCFYAALILGFILILALHKPDVSQLPLATNAITITHESAVYDAQGQIKSLTVACADSRGQAVACGEDITATEKWYLQDQHDQAVTKAQTAAAKKNHDR